MIVQQPAHITPSHKRKIAKNNGYTCCSSIYKLTKMPLCLSDYVLAVDDEIYAPTFKKEYSSEEDVLVVLMPLVGSLQLVVKNKEVALHPEDIRCFTLQKGDSFIIKNNHPEHTLNFLQIRLRTKASLIQKDIESGLINALSAVLKSDECSMYFGVFNARKKAHLTMNSNTIGCYVFLINGAFEVEDRLVESRDALWLRNTKQLELEALSENGIVLLLKFNE